MNSSKAVLQAVVIDVVAESRRRDDDGERPTPLLHIPFREKPEQEELKESKRKPVASLRGPESREEQRWRCQQQQEYHRRHDLNHKLMLDDLLRWTLQIVEQPPADKEEARQPEQEEHVVPPHPLVPKTVIADM